MSYIGNPPAEAYTNTVKDTFSGDGSTVAFTLSRPSLTNDVRVVVENVIQDPTVAYGVSGTTLTFTSAPPSGTNNIYVVHLGPAIQTAVPPSEISTNTTFAGNVTVQGAFTSQGIDDNANATAITIDSSENVLIGTTDTDPANSNVNGTAIGAANYFSMTRTNGASMILNRKSSDGDIALFRKDGSTVGSIAADGGFMSIGTGDVGLAFNSSVNTIHPNNQGTLAGSDGQVDLGYTNVRFKNLYLSGGVYLGGTGSANYLDDYEEGTWTPSVTGESGGTMGLSGATGSYVKVGRMVTVNGFVSISSAGSASGTLQFSNLPFTVADTVGSTSIEASGSISFFDSLSTAVNSLTTNAIESTTNLRLFGQTSATQTNNQGITVAQVGSSGSNLRFSCTYFTS